MPALSYSIERKRFLRRCAPWLLLLAGWLLIFGPTLLVHMQRAADPFTVSDDMRIQLPHFYHYRDPTLFQHDPIGEYHASGTGELFRWIYIGVGQLVDIVVLAKVLTYFAWLLTAAGVAVAAHRLAGKGAAFVAVCLVMGSSVFIDRVVGGLPRAFAYPTLAWAAVCLVSGRMRTLAALAVVGAGLYPVLPVICGLALGLALLVLPRRDRGSARKWSLRRRLAVLGITAAGCVAVMAPIALRMRPHGPVIHARDIGEFPEAGPGGRNNVLEGDALDSFFAVATLAASRTVLSTTRPFVPALRHLLTRKSDLRGPLLGGLSWVTALGTLGLGLGPRGARVRRLAVLALAVFVGFELAHAVHPSLAPTQRYAYMGIPPLVAILLPSAALGLLPRRLRLPTPFAAWTRPAWVFAWGGLVLAAFGSVGHVGFGWDTHYASAERRLFEAMRRLPHAAVIAGFPQGTMDDVPLGAQRAAFINYQMYMPYHQGMTRLMRQRALAVIDAYYSPSVDALVRLRDEFGVTHFLYEPSLARGRALFRPLGAEVRRRVAQLAESGRPSALATYDGPAVVFHETRYVLLDLQKL